MDDLVKPKSDSISKTRKITSKPTGIQARFEEAKAMQSNPAEMPNRIGLMLDASSSMFEYEGTATREELLKSALQGFIQACNFQDTAVAMYQFPDNANFSLCTSKVVTEINASLLETGGDTPMFTCMRAMLDREPITRGIIISDGQATDYVHEDIVMPHYIESRIPVDCIHIGSAQGGEKTLREIATLTGGIYIKFSEAAKLVSALKYLTPAYRALLESGDAAALLGADEVKK